MPAPTTMPTWEGFMVPVLQVLTHSETAKVSDIYEATANYVDLNPAQRAEVLPSGYVRFQGRVGWALSGLARSGALERPARGHYRITQVGRDLLASHPKGLIEKVLLTLPAYRDSLAEAEAVRLAKAAKAVSLEEPSHDLSPEEQIEQAVESIEADVTDQLLKRLHAQPPGFFEGAVLKLLMAMGYGGADGTAAQTQLSNDGGIDGVIDQDALGLSRVHVQAKRYAKDTAVSRPEIQGFIGAMAGSQANQGVFITTGRFTAGARDYAAAVPTRVVLIDGARLAALMIKFGVAVQVKRTVNIVEIDEDFFE